MSVTRLLADYIYPTRSAVVVVSQKVILK